MRLTSLLPLSLLPFLTTPLHTSNWAVLVSTSRFWFNYRHLANVLSLYRTVKRLGIPDSQIILMLPDDMACNPRNAFPGTVYNNADRALDLYGDNIEVDYRGYEVTVENFIRLLTDRLGEYVPRGKRLGSDAGSNVLVYMTGHGGNEFLKFQDSEEIGSWDLADAFEQMWEKKRYAPWVFSLPLFIQANARIISYNEMLFMIDTCQANTMYSRFYSPNIIATGSSEIDQSSYSHHADNDVGVAVIDRWTYYNLEFLETQVTSPASKLTLGNLFDSYDESKIHSKPGVRWDLFPGGAERGRERLVMDFFGNVQGVEVEALGNNTANEFAEDLSRLKEIVRRREVERSLSDENRVASGLKDGRHKQTSKNLSAAHTATQDLEGEKRQPGAAKVESTSGWSQQVMGAWALVGCVLIWAVASWLESSPAPS